MKLKTLSLVLLSLFLSSHSFAATELAKVNGSSIPLEEFNKKYQALLPLYQNKSPSKLEVLDDLIKRELGLQEARRQKIDKDPEVVEEMESALYQAFLRKTLSKSFEKISVTDTEAREYYQKYPDIRTSHIFAQVPPDASKEVEQAALQRIKDVEKNELKSDKSFAEVAQKFSEGVAAPMGGDIDYQAKDKLDPTYYKTALGLRSPGRVSGIIRSQFGYHIIKLTAIRPWSEVDHQAVKQSLNNEKRQQIFDRYMSGLRSKASVSVKKNLL